MQAPATTAELTVGGSVLRERRDWRIWLGLALTATWLSLGAAYISAVVGWSHFLSLPADELGSFLEGAFAPLAFLWLVIGYFLQQKELEQNTAALRAQAEEIHRTAEQAVIQSEKMAQAEVHSRQDAFMRVSQRVSEQLSTIAGLLYISSQAADAEGTVSPEEQSRLFGEASTGDTQLFSRRLLELHIQLQGEPDRQLALFFGTEVRARHTNHFIFAFERLLKRAEAVDPDGVLRDALFGSGHGFIYRIMKGHQAAAPEEWNDHTKTGVHINL